MTNTVPLQVRGQGALVGFGLFTHAMWFFGNLYEEVLFVPNGMAATAAQLTAFNAYFSVTKPLFYYVPLTHLGVLAVIVAAVRSRHGPPGVAPLLRRASLASCGGVLLTVFIVLHYNVRLWLGDVSSLGDAELRGLVTQWGAWNLVRLGLVGAAGRWLLQAHGARR